MRARSGFLLGASLLALGALPRGGAAAADDALKVEGSPVVYEGMCEPSAAVAATAADGSEVLAVANDGDNRLRVYRAEGGAADASGLDLDPFFGIPENAAGKGSSRADIEAAARLGDRIYWIGSHSRENDEGERRENRHRFFATTFEPAPAAGGSGFVLRPVGTSRSLIGALAERRLGLRAAIGVDDRGKERKKDKALRAEGNGLNIEGLARGREEGTLLIGLRNPLRGGEAILIPFSNPREVVDSGDAEPVLGSPIRLRLGGAGIRSIEYAEEAPPGRRYLIVAGPRGVGDRFSLWRWSGERRERPVEVSGAAALLRRLAAVPDPRGAPFRFGPEAMVVGPEGKTIRLLSDDGDRPIAGPNGSEKCQGDDTPVERRSFRGVVLRLD